MTNKQKREHKLGNQIRKLEIIKSGRIHKGKPSNPVPYLGAVCQNGKYTAQAQKLVKL